MNQAARLHPELDAPRVETAREHARNALQLVEFMGDQVHAAVETRGAQHAARLRELFDTLEGIRGRLLEAVVQMEAGNV